MEHTIVWVVFLVCIAFGLEILADVDSPPKENVYAEKGECIAYDAAGKEVAWLVKGDPEFVIITIRGLTAKAPEKEAQNG